MSYLAGGFFAVIQLIAELKYKVAILEGRDEGAVRSEARDSAMFTIRHLAEGGSGGDAPKRIAEKLDEGLDKMFDRLEAERLQK